MVSIDLEDYSHCIKSSFEFVQEDFDAQVTLLLITTLCCGAHLLTCHMQGITISYAVCKILCPSILEEKMQPFVCFIFHRLIEFYCEE